MTLPIIIVAVVAFIAFWMIATYNKFVTIKTRIEAAISEIGNQMKRQADLIPNLMESVKGYAKHEKEIFKDLTDARKMAMQAADSGSAQKMVDASSRLLAALAPIRAVFESTPQLQAAGPTVKLMDELRDTADKVMYSRRTLIDLTADYNVMIVAFPSSLIAGVFAFGKMPGLKMPASATDEIAVTPADMATPKVKL